MAHGALGGTELVYTLGARRDGLGTRGFGRPGIGLHAWASEGLFWHAGLSEGRNWFTHLGFRGVLLAHGALGGTDLVYTLGLQGDCFGTQGFGRGGNGLHAWAAEGLF